MTTFPSLTIALLSMHIIEELGTEQDKAELQKYKEDFNKYAKRRIFESLPEFGPVNEINHADIFVKVDSQYENYTVKQIEGLRRNLVKSYIFHPKAFCASVVWIKGVFSSCCRCLHFYSQEYFHCPNNRRGLWKLRMLSN